MSQAVLSIPDVLTPRPGKFLQNKSKHVPNMHTKLTSSSYRGAVWTLSSWVRHTEQNSVSWFEVKKEQENEQQKINSEEGHSVIRRKKRFVEVFLFLSCCYCATNVIWTVHVVVSCECCDIPLLQISETKSVPFLILCVKKKRRIAHTLSFQLKIKG